MKISNNTILITGGASSIGLSMAEAFLIEGNTVIVDGRRQEAWDEVKARFPQLNTRQCDIALEAKRGNCTNGLLRSQLV